MNTDAPDIFELEAWIRANQPEMYGATRYLQPEVQYPAWLSVYQKRDAHHVTAQAGRVDWPH